VAPREARSDTVARRLPARPLPAWTFVAGRSPRPPDGWFDDVDAGDRFAFGCDLFDAGFYFEAHELWESCWHETKARMAAVAVDSVAHACAAADERLLRALIHLAAAGVKLLDDKPASRARHVERAVTLAGDIDPRTRGLPADALARAAAILLGGGRPELT
jgi:hypothetical protein